MRTLGEKIIGHQHINFFLWYITFSISFIDRLPKISRYIAGKQNSICTLIHHHRKDIKIQANIFVSWLVMIGARKHRHAVSTVGRNAENGMKSCNNVLPRLCPHIGQLLPRDINVLTKRSETKKYVVIYVPESLAGDRA